MATIPKQAWSAVAQFRLSDGRCSRLNCRAGKGHRISDEEQDDGTADSREPLGSGLCSSKILDHEDLRLSVDSSCTTPVPDVNQFEGCCIKKVESVELDTHPVAAGSVFGAMAMITGSSVGAGILALPAITAPTGFIPSATLMSVSWAFLVIEALLLAEVNVELMRRRETKEKLHSEVLSLRTMANQTMGPVGGMFTTVIYLMLSYTLIVAYIAKSGEVLSLLLNIPNRAADVLFTIGLGGLLSVGGTKMADSLNQVLTIMLLGFFLLIVVGGASMADWTGLEHADWTVAPQTLPIIFLALVYHDLTPVVCAQLGGDLGRIRKSIILGSIVPLAMFLSWNAVALCLAPLSISKDSIAVLVRVHGPGPAFVVESFALLAVATSFIGTVLGLSEFLLEQLGLIFRRPLVCHEAPGPIFKLFSDYGARAFSFLLVLAPPFVASTLVSDAFYSASDLAGAYGMTSLYGVIPPIMAWSLQYSDVGTLQKGNAVQGPNTQARKISVLGGKITLATVSLCASAVIICQAVLDIPLLSTSLDTFVLLAKGDQGSLAPIKMDTPIHIAQDDLKSNIQHHWDLENSKFQDWDH